MRCLDCRGKNISVISQIKECAFSSCKEELEVALGHEEEISFLVICPQHKDRLSFIEVSIDV
jgi:hypothetical protein